MLSFFGVSQSGKVYPLDSAHLSTLNGMLHSGWHMARAAQCLWLFPWAAVRWRTISRHGLFLAIPFLSLPPPKIRYTIRNLTDWLRYHQSIQRPDISLALTSRKGKASLWSHTRIFWLPFLTHLHSQRHPVCQWPTGDDFKYYDFIKSIGRAVIYHFSFGSHGAVDLGARPMHRDAQKAEAQASKKSSQLLLFIINIDSDFRSVWQPVEIGLQYIHNPRQSRQSKSHQVKSNALAPFSPLSRVSFANCNMVFHLLS